MRVVFPGAMGDRRSGGVGGHANGGGTTSTAIGQKDVVSCNHNDEERETQYREYPSVFPRSQYYVWLKSRVENFSCESRGLSRMFLFRKFCQQLESLSLDV